MVRAVQNLLESFNININSRLLELVRKKFLSTPQLLCVHQTDDDGSGRFKIFRNVPRLTHFLEESNTGKGFNITII